MQIMHRFERRNALFVRTEHCVTAVMDGRHVQIILRLYKSPAEVLMGFDLDSCAIMYDGEDVFSLPRCVRALRYQMNMVDSTRQSKSYVHRLIKYAKRGFAVGVPGLDRSRVNSQIFAMPIGDLGGLARLLVLETLFIQGYDGAVGKCMCSNGSWDGTGVYPGTRQKGSVCPRHRAGRKKVQTLSLTARNRDTMFENEFISGICATDYSSTFIPQGNEWRVGKVEAFLDTRFFGLKNAGRPVPFVHSRRVDVIVRKPEAGYAIGALTWITENPGAQLTGSFHLLTDDFFRNAFHYK
jgi:hypothetical protein